MRNRTAGLTTLFLLGLLIIGFSVATGCSSQSSAGSTPIQSQSETSLSDNTQSTSAPSITQPPSEVPSNTVSVVIAGYINHGPMQPTVRAIKEILSKYDDKVAVTWVDLATTEGQSYFQDHGLTAHMNIIINGASSYQVDGKTVDFEWFEGQQWTKEELDSVLANLVSR